MSKMIEYDQPTNAPVPKMVAVGQASAIIGALVALLTAMGVTVPDSVPESAQNAVAAVMMLIAAVQGFIPWLAGYFKKDIKPAEAVNIIKKQSP